MRITILRISFIGFFLFFLIFPAQAANSLDVEINEVAWMGTQTAYQDEWIELYNNTDSSINLDGWLLQATDGTPEINLAGTVQAYSFYLLERTDDTAVPDVAADQIYTGALGNNGEDLKLVDQNNLIDEVNCSEGWFAGSNPTKQTMERINSNLTGTVPENWQTSQNPGGTPKSQNSTGQPPEPVCKPVEEICDGIDNDCDDLIDEDLGETTCGIGACKVNVTNCIDGVAQTCTPGLQTEEICDSIDNDCDSEIDEGGACQTPEPTTEPDPISYPSGIFINEFLPSPEGPDVEEEWIEFYNSNTMLINLSGWSIEDTHGKTKSYTFPVGATISSHGFLILDRPTSKIVLNNDGEGLVLKNPLGNSSSSVAYEGKAPLGQSYAREIDNTWKWILAPSPGEENSFTLPEETVPEAEPEAQPEPKTETIEEPRPESELEEPELEPSFAEAVEVKPQPKLITYPSGVVINEILPSPTGPDEEEEWIEVFNQNNFEVDLSGWQIQDIKGRVKTYNFSQGTKIGPQGFLVLSRPTTKITLNNDGDGISLIQPNNNIIDQVSYDKAPTGSSYNRTGSGWTWSDTLTPDSKNIIPAQASEKDEEETGSLSEISERELAAIGKQFTKSSRSLSVLLIASVVSIFSGIIILILKSKIKLN